MLISEILLSVLFVVCVVGLIVCSIGLVKTSLEMKRNHKVAEFRTILSDMSYDYAMRNYKTEGLDEVNKVWDWFANKWTYDEMLKSSKPLTLEAWYTPEEIERINA